MMVPCGSRDVNRLARRGRGPPPAAQAGGWAARSTGPKSAPRRAQVTCMSPPRGACGARRAVHGSASRRAPSWRNAYTSACGRAV